MRTRRLFLITLVVLTALAVVDGYADAPSSRWGWEGFVVTGPRQVVAGDAQASVTRQLSTPLGTGEILVIANPRGSIQVTGEDRPDAAVEYTISVFGDTQEQAAAYAGQFQLVSEREGGRLRLDVIEPDARPEAIAGFVVEWRVRMPRGARVDLSNGFGPVEVEGVSGPSRVENQYEETTVRRVEGDWDVRPRFAALQVTDVNGALHIDGGYAAGHVSRVTGPVTGAFEFGVLDVEDAGSLDVKSSYGGVQAGRIRGPVRLDLSFSGASIEEVAHDLQVTGRYGDVNVELSPAAPGFRIEAESRGGRIRNNADRLQGQSVTQSGDRSRFEAVLGDGSRMVRLSIQNGTVTLR